MKLLASIVLFGVAAVAVGEQQVLQHVKEAKTGADAPVAMQFPGEICQATLFSSPKPHQREPDSAWDYVMKGAADIQLLKDYNLRAKKVSPSDLGIDTVRQYSGYLDDEANDKHLFYWFFESRNDPKNDPIILWLSGGPGCSSLTGLFFELGPAKVDKDLKIHNNPYSWNSNASILFLDQPVNVGYSYSSTAVSNTIAASKDVYALLTLFFEQFPEYSKQDFHIAGEAYAGHYIPSIASEILSHKKRNINLKSVLIGNGLVDQLTQYAFFKPTACGEGGWPAALDEGQCQAMENALPRCQQLIETCYESGSTSSCVTASSYCNDAMIIPYERTGQNVYDVREKCGNHCYPGLDWISQFLNQNSVMKALGAEVSTYESCNNNIYRNFSLQGDWMRPFYRLVPQILEEIPVLIYAGDADFICNWLGVQAWTEALEWPGKKAFNSAKTNSLELASGKKTGTLKTSGNFTLMRLFGAGHMTPADQPEASLDFLNRWISGEWHNMR